MTLFAQFLIFSLSLGWGFNSSAFAAKNCERTLVMVQVEDTLKLSHVQNFWDSLNYTTDTKQRFIGMNAALNLLARVCSANFVYLTQGPELVAGKTEREFVKRYDFPRGRFRKYSTNADPLERAGILRNIIQLARPTRVILISHNGGTDPEIFHNLAVEFKDILFMQYIHLVYSTGSSSEMGSILFPEQTGYVTAVELLVDWQTKSLIGFDETAQLARTLISRIVAEMPEASGIVEYAVPGFMSCDDFQWKWSIENNYSFLAPLRAYLVDRCKVPTRLSHQ